MGSLANYHKNLPVIEFAGDSIVPGSTSWQSTSANVVRALEVYGCFLAICDRFAPGMHDSIFHAAEELLSLPIDVKVKNISETPSHGYVGQVALIPLYEGLGIENATTRQGVDDFIKLMWPSGNRTFRETTLEYSKIVAQLDQVVMRMVSESYGITNSYEALLEKTSYLLRLLKYRKPNENESGLGIVPHTDKSFMTILHQNRVPGLEIKAKNGHNWIVVDPSPKFFIVMAGDACMAWTNGRIEAPQHRVMMMKGSEERYCVGLFTFIKDIEIEVAKELVDDENPLQFEPFDHYKFIHFYYTDEGKRAKCPIKAYCGI
ncbi:2-oxoglutarate (2OG) and Fe(II)-dependent oxygenase superfamily protein [Striga hermonthica]|uniref:2-oxoglutarate (2OG) and Fe(II)-dependent oxygenase superfamily protein n=1 Tax=Striga hermonthica TaxID=68872 RepID=A0A9N7NVZ8_STRHE|nr:2-oxoglutarate (2OG) and Fe(II)-dependent oxygenase superfamily protein [Striga hermonthica]